MPSQAGRGPGVNAEPRRRATDSTPHRSMCDTGDPIPSCDLGHLKLAQPYRGVKLDSDGDFRLGSGHTPPIRTRVPAGCRRAQHGPAIGHGAITDQRQQAVVLTRLAAGVATDPDRAEASIAAALRGAQSVIGTPAVSIAESVRRRSKRSLAPAWSIARWEVPLPALPVVEPSVLRAIASEVAGEHEF